MPAFTDLEIEKIFGADDAEGEENGRFLQYFYSNNAYESLLADIRIRILVGHKGVGKSALLKRAFLLEDKPPPIKIWFRPGDLVEMKQIVAKADNLNTQVEAWKRSILLFICKFLTAQLYQADIEKVLPDIDSLNIASLRKLIVESLRRQNYAHPYGVILYVDDIDRGWAASKEDITQISALLNCIRDLANPQSEPRLTFRIGLRTDVYYLVRTSDESTDKIERNVIWLKWNNDSILRLMALRIQTYFNDDISNISLLEQSQLTKLIFSKVIDPVFSGLGKWESKPIHYILSSMTRARPRDMVKLLRGAAKNAHVSKNIHISTGNLKDYFPAYSQDRLQDIINEFKSELPDIKRLLFEMKPTRAERTTDLSYQFTTDRLSSKVGNILRTLPLRFTNGHPVTPRSIIQFFYKIDFITARIATPAGGIERRFFDESRFLADEIADFGFGWEIHPAYRWALQPQNVDAVLAQIFKEPENLR